MKIQNPSSILPTPNAGIELFLATERRSKNRGAMSWSTPRMHGKRRRLKK
jgi:hypothetical protein